MSVIFERRLAAPPGVIAMRPCDALSASLFLGRHDDADVEGGRS